MDSEVVVEDDILLVKEAMLSQTDCSETISRVKNAVRGAGKAKKKFEEEIWWLDGLQKRRNKEYPPATSSYDRALAVAHEMHVMDPRRGPSRVCMESLTGRASCHLRRQNPLACAVDLKEWLRLRHTYWKELDPTSVYYTLGICYKNLCYFQPASYWFTRSIDSAKNVGIIQEQKFKQAKEAVQLISAMGPHVTEDIIIEEILKFGVLPGAPQLLAPKLLALRMRIHCYLAFTSKRVLHSKMVGNNAAKRRSWFNKLFDTSCVNESTIDITKIPIETVKEVIINVAASVLVRLLGGGNDVIRKYLTCGTAPAVFRLLDQSGIKPTLRSALNFTAEFTLNFSQMGVWRGANLSEAEISSMCSLDKAAVLPFPVHEDVVVPKKASDDVIAAHLLDDVYCSDDEVTEHVEKDDLLQNSFTSGSTSTFVPQLAGLEHESSLLSEDECRRLCQVLPTRYSCKNWKLEFSTRLHGFSLSTLLRNGADIGPNIILIQTVEGDLFGGFTSDSWQPCATHFGNGETTVFSFKTCNDDTDSTLCTWHWSGTNRFFVLCKSDTLAFGGGSSCAFSIEGQTLDSGTTGYCETFDSPSLCSSPGRYVIAAAECWSFAGDDDDDDIC
eukprot:TRINITY_DN6286_c0_g1_i1.p1 TRINITY_DN6286_c0_g1~~TRINITY_DN6286_c0_g1_i1.p1  ORF type:complete len:613 (+),score=98.25 TRINITY_DN6286_c0_g1_i1:71-1909(+)